MRPRLGEINLALVSLYFAPAWGAQALHALRLEFVHPSTARTLSFEAPLPGDFAGLVSRLRTPA